MPEVTYVALPFVAADDGVATGEPTECLNPVAVVMRAEALSRKTGHVGAVAFSRTGDPATGDFSDAKVIKKFGDVPDDLSKYKHLPRKSPHFFNQIRHLLQVLLPVVYPQKNPGA